MTVHRSLLKPRVVATVTFALLDKVELRLDAPSSSKTAVVWVRGVVVAAHGDGSYDVEHFKGKKPSRKKGAKPPSAEVAAAVRSDRMRRAAHSKGKAKGKAKGKKGKKGKKK